ncbi:hypothetical protein IU485_17155 [Nocardia cyriacigeorgica]|uniref:hypothetical protein n=1 Tax=Nocardia cyriacigeorgica TaxID=135487 RepID=UPI001895EE66|nr:hypothetical protein [Nocardia cyriacigeorgica]MBF6083095.1 hypothetical protein [Nocardia cyriacigeorgica]
MSVDPDNITCPGFWHRRLTTNYQNQLTPEQAIQSWIGVPEDPRCGGVPANATVLEAPSKQALWDQLNPEGPPIGEGPWVQDDEFPSGTPVDRSKGWSTPHMVRPPNYSGQTSTDSPVHFVPITKHGQVVAFLWGSPTEQAAGYVPLTHAGKNGIVGRGRWIARLSDSFAAGRDPVEAIRYCRRFPHDEYSGWIDPNEPELVAPSLTELREAADE